MIRWYIDISMESDGMYLVQEADITPEELMHRKFTLPAALRISIQNSVFGQILVLHSARQDPRGYEDEIIHIIASIASEPTQRPMFDENHPDLGDCGCS